MYFLGLYLYKGHFRIRMQSVWFSIEKLPGYLREVYVMANRMVLASCTAH